MISTQLTTADGHVLAADLADPDGDVRGVVVLCHPHPRYGGDRHNAVVEALFRALPSAGFRTMRFDFRAEHGDGITETRDVIAAIDAANEGCDGIDRTDATVIVVGYSFGAAVALRTVDARIGRTVAIAPPLTAMPVDPPTLPTLVLTPRHDQYCPPAVAAPIVSAWRTAEFEVVESSDHFLTGRSGAVADRVVAWLG